MFCHSILLWLRKAAMLAAGAAAADISVHVMCYHLGVITFLVASHGKTMCPFAGNYSQL